LISPFIYDESAGGYRLSPAYDLTKTLYKPEHEMTVNGNGFPTEKNLSEAAKIMKLSTEECSIILSQIKHITGVEAQQI